MALSDFNVLKLCCFFVFLASFKFCGHVTQCSALLFITTNILYGFLCAVFAEVMVQLHQFFLLDGTGMVVKPTCSPHPHYLSNPSSHNEANMSNPIIIPCLFNNSGALSRIFFSSLLRVVLPRPFPFTHAGVSWSFPCSRAPLHGCHSARGGRVCSLLCKKKNMLYDSLHSALLTYTTTNKIFGGQ